MVKIIVLVHVGWLVLYLTGCLFTRSGELLLETHRTGHKRAWALLKTGHKRFWALLKRFLDWLSRND